MAKFPTFPTLYNEVNQLKISRLIEWGYLDSGFHSGVITWSSGGKEIASISIRSYCNPEPEYIELDYNYRQESRRYKIHFDYLPSNLGKGKLWYFICPHTLKRCRILYCIGGYFYHRKAFRNVYYESQNRSKNMRLIEKNFGSYFRQDAIYDELRKKYFKSFYKGKPTKRYKRLMLELQSAKRHSVEDIQRLFVFGKV